jgi:Alr-MurF fusion protein
VYTVQEFCNVIKGTFLLQEGEANIEHLAFDTRRLQQPATSLFFALKTEHNDGHKFLGTAYKKGVRNFVVSATVDTKQFPFSNILIVKDVLASLQQIAAYHRKRFHFPVIGITGSNGKTIVKEWLFQLLQEDYNIVRSPKSFNSQIGVALSVWLMKQDNNLGLFEAGISKPGEMDQLKAMIQPTIGLITNLGEAHDEGFTSKDQKLSEKLRLFKDAEIIFGPLELLKGNWNDNKIFSWGYQAEADLYINNIHRSVIGTTITAKYSGKEVAINIPFSDDASIGNAISCLGVLLHLGIEETIIIKRFAHLHPVDMRLQLMHGINECLVVNDSYSADTVSLKIALDFMQQQSSGLKRTAILSDFFETGRTKEDLYAVIARLLQEYKIEKLITVGKEMGELLPALAVNIETLSFPSVEDFLHEFRSSLFFKEIILVKGARKFGFERIVQLFEKKMHQTVLEINLNALAHNLKEYKSIIRPSTKIMAMVKAFAYGSGGAEIASVLQYHNIDYLGVAYADEGVELIKAGINTPVMVMNAEESSFQSIVDYNLQPVIYSFDLLGKFQAYLQQQAMVEYPVHIEIETGMNRLGFALTELEVLGRKLAIDNVFQVASIFSHLAASEEEAQDAFTFLQAQRFQEACSILQHYLSYPFLRHISNSAAIVRHPGLQMDMVRLGIGLYGIEIDHKKILNLQAVAILRSTIAQLKQVKAGDSISYNRRGVVHRDSLIATIRVGYADGYSRQFGNGKGKMLIRRKLAPVVGTICMDMTMVDVTDIPGVKEGDEVIIFGPDLDVEKVASWANTIPYEIMTGVSQRVKRMYFHE